MTIENNVSTTVFVSTLIILIIYKYKYKPKSVLKTILNNLDIVYDIGNCAFSIFDIICDLLVAYNFYKNGHYIFFYVSVSIFILAQITYSVIFSVSLTQIKPNFMGFHQNDDSLILTHAFISIIYISFWTINSIIFNDTRYIS